ncbi:MAG: 3-oxoacyl-ACP synthase [gamma proteobacterium symbiont of Ctena orbiculata]|nr:MAG: 3-oxoacyl-ACP synthase [gamma proteobacterium symbiont of Ctena orbiculata]PVV16748.1 MAG: 3-oxoacyl-ACP synthase [gamma proteobacterium symbiont of Ctena orbiculata]
MGLPLAITATGMVTGVGLSAPATCAAIRCAIDNFQETRFMDSGGEWILGCEVPLEKPWRGKTKLIKMASAAIKEVLQENTDINPAQTPLLLCLAEHSRPGRIIDDDAQLFLDLQDELGFEFSDQSLVIAGGHVAVAIALKHARELIHQQGARHVLVAASDTMLIAPTLAHYEEQERLLTSDNSNGFIPGEAGAALLVESASGKSENLLCCEGLGFAVEGAHIESEEPLRAEGLTAAIKESLTDAGCETGDLDFRITDISGEQYHFKEASLALSRTLRERKAEFDIWHPADCVGEVGSAQGLIMLSVLKAACEKEYSKGARMFAHMGNDDGKRSCIILTWGRGGGN